MNFYLFTVHDHRDASVKRQYTVKAASLREAEDKLSKHFGGSIGFFSCAEPIGYDD